MPGSKLPILGMVIPPLIGNPCNGHINPYYKVDEFIPIGKEREFRSLFLVCFFVFFKSFCQRSVTARVNFHKFRPQPHMEKYLIPENLSTHLSNPRTAHGVDRFPFPAEVQGKPVAKCIGHN